VLLCPCRVQHRLIYRSTIAYQDLKKACTGLQAKRPVYITATKKSLVETVQVRARR